MEFRGSKVPTNKNAVKEAIKDLHKACIDGGASGDLALISHLKTLGLLPSVPECPPVPGAGDFMDKVEEQQQQKLLDDHHKEVFSFVLKLKV